MSTAGTLAGIFFEPTNVFRNLRAHPRWLAAILIMGCLNAAYQAAFYQRLTPERIVDYTFEKLKDSPIKPPEDRMAIARQQALDAAKLPLARAGNAIKTVVGVFFVIAFSRHCIFSESLPSEVGCISARMPWPRTQRSRSW